MLNEAQESLVRDFANVSYEAYIGTRHGDVHFEDMDGNESIYRAKEGGSCVIKDADADQPSVN
ncbi:MAG: hypothetical protein IBX55_00570 [Methyloprofundus sp.]|nr:hypothetical protein [Methyloprofundus sp.]